MNSNKSIPNVVVATMNPREKSVWETPKKMRRKRSPARWARKRGGVRRARILPKHLPALAAAFCCLGVGVYASVREGSVSAVFDHLTAGFEYDETLGRLQLVSNILPESAMVFLSGTEEPDIEQPVSGEVLHAWNESEPWLEYACSGEVTACADGEIMAIVKNRSDAYTVRVMHEGGLESLYSGVKDVALHEGDLVAAGQRIGQADGRAAFELRRGALSVQPVFGSH